MNTYICINNEKQVEYCSASNDDIVRKFYDGKNYTIIKTPHNSKFLYNTKTYVLN